LNYSPANRAYSLSFLDNSSTLSRADICSLSEKDNQSFVIISRYMHVAIAPNLEQAHEKTPRYMFSEVEGINNLYSLQGESINLLDKTPRAGSIGKQVNSLRFLLNIK